MATTSNQYDGTPIDQDYEEPYDWKVGPCAGMTWLEWCEAQLEAMDVVIDPTDDDADKQEETELVCPPTPRASASRSVKRQLFKSPPKNQTQTQNLHHPTTLVEEISTIQDLSVLYEFLHWYYSARRLMESWIIESAAYCFQIFRPNYLC